MSEYSSVCGRIPAAHKDNIEAVLNLIQPNEVAYTIELSAVPHPVETGYAQAPATHYAFNHETSSQEFIDKIALAKGNIDDVLPEVQWGTNGLPTKGQAVAALAAGGFFQRLDEETTPQEHFDQNCGPGSALGLKIVWLDL